MTTVDDLWYLADEADQQAEQTFHRLGDRYDDFLQFETTKHVPRHRFRTVARRIDAAFTFTTLGGDHPAVPARPETLPGDTLYWARGDPRA